MAASQMLTARDRDFFLRVGKIVFANPFSDARARQVREVAGDVMRPGMADAEALMTVISRRLQALDAQGTFALSDLSAEDARCAKPVFLFCGFRESPCEMVSLLLKRYRLENSNE